MSQAAAPRAGEATFSSRTVLALLAAGLFAFSAFVVLAAYAPDLRGGSDGGAHALSRSAVGYAGAVRLLKALGDPVLISRGAKARAASTGLVVLTPDVSVDPQALAAMASGGPTLVVLPKWMAYPDTRNPGWVVNAEVIPAPSVGALAARRFGALTIVRDPGAAPVRLDGLPGGPRLTGAIDQLQTLSGGDGLIPLARDQRGRVILAASRDRRAFVLSDPDLLNTQGLKSLATARAGAAVVDSLRQGDGPIVFDVTLNGFKRSRNLLKLAFEPPFLGASLCVLAAALMTGFQALNRFGAPRREARAVALGKQALADNSAALIRLARREPRMAGRYLELTRAAAAHALGAARLDAAALDALLDRQASRRRPGQPIAGLAAEAAAVKDTAGLMRLARALYDWRMEVTGERH